MKQVKQAKKLFKSRLFGNTLIYGITNAIYSGLPLILLPFLVKVLAPEDYGIVDLFRSLCMVLVPLLGLSAVQSIGRFYYDLNETDFKKFVTSIQIFQFSTSLFALVVITIFSSWIEPKYVSLLYLCVVYFFFGQIVESLMVIYRVRERAKTYLLIRVLNIGMELGLLYVLFITLHDFDWTFRVYPAVLANVVVGLIAVGLFFKAGFKPDFSKQQLRSALIYSTPLILHMVSGYMLNIGDRIFIKHFLTEKDLGNYAVAYQVGMAINFFYSSFNLAWSPTYFKWMKNKQYRSISKVKRIVFTMLPLMGLLILLIWFIVRPILLASTSYVISSHIVIVILIANVIFSLYKFEANYFLYNKKTKRLSSYTLTSALIAVVLNIILIPVYGILGAAYATLISFITIFCLVTFNRRKQLRY